MDKPLSLAIEETKNNLIQVINTSNLTPVLLKPIIKDIYDEVQALYIQELQADRKKYEESLKEQNKENNEGAE